jgi:hypothetical protein
LADEHKVAERVGARDRVRDKDALDILRILRAIPSEQLAERLDRLASSNLASPVTAEAITVLPTLFGTTTTEGVRMAVRAAGTSEDPATIASSLVALTADLLALLN